MLHTYLIPKYSFLVYGELLKSFAVIYEKLKVTDIFSLWDWENTMLAVVSSYLYTGSCSWGIETPQMASFSTPVAEGKSEPLRKGSWSSERWRLWESKSLTVGMYLRDSCASGPGICAGVSLLWSSVNLILFFTHGQLPSYGSVLLKQSVTDRGIA